MEDASALFRLDGKIALITGGSRGLGKGMAEALAAFGADIVLVARDADRLAQAADDLRLQGTGVWTHVLDIQNGDMVREVYASILSHTGGVDILINNASISHRAPAAALAAEDWQHVLDVGLSGAFRMSQVFAQERLASKRPGKIINVGSLMCHGTRAGTAAYTAMKMGLHGLTRALAIDWAPHGITVNTIAPGYFVTDLTRSLAEQPEFDQWVRDSTPIGRWGEPADLAGTVVFLAAPASNFVTGQILYVDGGWTAAL